MFRVTITPNILPIWPVLPNSLPIWSMARPYTWQLLLLTFCDEAITSQPIDHLVQSQSILLLITQPLPIWSVWQLFLPSFALFDPRQLLSLPPAAITTQHFANLIRGSLLITSQPHYSTFACLTGWAITYQAYYLPTFDLCQLFNVCLIWSVQTSQPFTCSIRSYCLPTFLVPLFLCFSKQPMFHPIFGPCSQQFVYLIDGPTLLIHCSY
jgi:hypothetical protein